MKGKIIVIEGTDCSGKETQSNLLIEKLTKAGINVKKFCFPNYDSPTGKIVGGPYLGKEYLGKPLFPEGAVNVDPKVASLYFAADRKYNIKNINNEIENGVNVVLDRYIDSNLAHQGSKIKDAKEREKMFSFLEKLEYDLLELPVPDINIFLFMPIEQAKILKKNRAEKPDQHEIDDTYLKNSEDAYFEICKRRKYNIIKCVKDNKIKSIEEISNEVYDAVIKEL